MWVLKAGCVVGWPGVRSENSLCGSLLLLQGLSWSSGSLSWPLSGLSCRLVCAMTSPHGFALPPAVLAKPFSLPVPIHMALPSQDLFWPQLLSLVFLLFNYCGIGPLFGEIPTLPAMLSPMILSHFPHGSSHHCGFLTLHSITHTWQRVRIWSAS